MKKIIFCSILFLSAASLLQAQQQTDSLFVMQYTPGPKWQEGVEAYDQLHFSTHSALMGKLRKEGYIQLGGLYSDKGFMLVKYSSKAALLQTLQDDSTLTYQVFTAEVYAFDLFYDGCVK